MNEKQRKLLALYRDLWIELSATNAFIEQLQDHARDIKARQRSMANSVAALDAEDEEVPASARTVRDH